MLSRTADSMFWLARYIERMDCLARLLEAAQRMSGHDDSDEEWRSAIVAAGQDVAFFEKYEKADAASVAQYLACDRDNPSSIMMCMEHARSNARAMRTALTRDMWDAVNETWLEGRHFGAEQFNEEQLPRTLDWVKEKATRFNGAYITTMLRNDVYYFTRLGTFVERADNTARILDVKYHLLLPGWSGVGGMLDYYQWTSILQAVSAVRAYRWVYKAKINPLNVADLLILRPEMPRSLRACYDEIVDALSHLADFYGGRTGECHRLAGEISARLLYGRIDAIFRSGLHEFLVDVIDRTADLGEEVSKFYMR
jgi:uncharacterized alpha-E superfamily protein